MKKTYIRPESRLFVIDLAENIATSVTGELTTTGGIHYYLFSNGLGGYIANNELYSFVVYPGYEPNDCVSLFYGQHLILNGYQDITLCASWHE